MNHYRVTMTKQAPAWDERNGIDFEVEAMTKAEAVKAARRMADRDGHTGKNQGKFWFKAEEIDAPIFEERARW